MKGSFISKFSGDTTGVARCPGPTNPGAAGGTLTTRLILRCCDMSSPSEINSPFTQNAYPTALAPFECRIADHAPSTQVLFLSHCDAIYSCVAALALKMPLKLSRYCRKTRIHNTQATRAGAMVPGDIV